MLTRAGRIRARVPGPGASSARAGALASAGAGVIACALGALLAALFASVAVDYLTQYRRDANLQHAPLVIAAAGWLAWRARSVQAAGAESTLAGVAVAVAGVALELAAWFAGSLGLEIVALIVTLLGTLAATASAALAWRLAFPAAFLLFAAPVPEAIYQPLALTLQACVCALATWVLQLLGVAVLRQGSLLHLPGHALDVGLACAGVRQASAFLALTLAASHLSGRAWGYRSVLTMLALPIALAANVARVLLTAAIVLWFGPRWAGGTWHDVEGITLVAFGVVLVWMSAYLLARVPARAFGLRDEPPSRPGRVPAFGRSRWRPVLGVLLVGIALKGAVARHLAGVEPSTPGALPQTLQSLPNVLGDWRGTDLPIPPSWGAGESRIRRRYRNARTGEAAVVWAEYSSRGADRRHHPEICMAVDGVREDGKSQCTIPLPGQRAPAQRFRFVGPSGAQLVYYWHYTFPPASHARRDALQRLHQRLHATPASVTIEVFTPEPLHAADAGVSPLPALVDRALAAQLPPGTIRGSARLPVFLVNGPFAGVWR